jgi:hypothetical protein
MADTVIERVSYRPAASGAKLLIEGSVPLPTGPLPSFEAHQENCRVALDQIWRRVQH